MKICENHCEIVREKMFKYSCTNLFNKNRVPPPYLTQILVLTLPLVLILEHWANFQDKIRNLIAAKYFRKNTSIISFRRHVHHCKRSSRPVPNNLLQRRLFWRDGLPAIWSHSTQCLHRLHSGLSDLGRTLSFLRTSHTQISKNTSWDGLVLEMG